MKDINDFQTFMESLTAASNEDNGFSNLARPLANLGPGQISGLLAGLLREIRDQGRLPRQMEGHIYLHRGEMFSVLLRFAGLGARAMPYAANEYDAFIVNLSCNTLRIPRLKCSFGPGGGDVRPDALHPVSPLELEPLGVHYEAAFSSVLDFDAVEPQAPVLIVHSPPRAHTTWTFDRETREPLQCISTDLNASRIQLLLELLSAMDTGGLEGPLEQLATSDLAGFARWDAVKLLHRRSPQKGMAILRRIAEDDPEPALRKAARATLEKVVPEAGP